jgi:succinyl-diaminopimelate desuccinylase
MPASPHADLLNRITTDEVTAVCRDLVRLRTVNPPGDERIAADYVADYLSRAGFETAFLPLGDGRASVLARLRGRGRPGLLLNGHIDVVPVGAQGWRFEPFEGHVTEGKVWGRGASDMKGGVAALMVAARAVAQAAVAGKLALTGDLLLAATADEEAGMTGARHVAARPDLGPLQAIIIAEPTSNRVGLAERGVLWLEITTHGKTAHGSMPELGHNAVTDMVALLAELDALAVPYTPHPILSGFTRSINTIKGGVKTNVVPDHCVVTVDMRTVPGQDHAALVAQVSGLADRMKQARPGFRATLHTLYDLPAVTTARDEPVVGRFYQVAAQATGRPAPDELVRFATEASIYLPALHVPTIIYGPGDPALAHQPDEYVEVDQMLAAARVYALAAAQLLG